MNRARAQKGFTVVEIVVTIVILAIALIGVAAIVQLGSSESAEVMQETRAIALAESYLDEILGKRFDEQSDRSGLIPCYGVPSDLPTPARPCTAAASFGPDSGEGSRDKWDDVDDYDGLKEGFGETITIPQDQEGNDRTGYDNFHVEISVRYAGDDAEWGALDKTDAKLILVTINFLGQDAGWKFSAYKGNY